MVTAARCRVVPRLCGIVDSRTDLQKQLGAARAAWFSVKVPHCRRFPRTAIFDLYVCLPAVLSSGRCCGGCAVAAVNTGNSLKSCGTCGMSAFPLLNLCKRHAAFHAARMRHHAALAGYGQRRQPIFAGDAVFLGAVWNATRCRMAADTPAQHRMAAPVTTGGPTHNIEREVLA